MQQKKQDRMNRSIQRVPCYVERDVHLKDESEMRVTRPPSPAPPHRPPFTHWLKRRPPPFVALLVSVDSHLCNYSRLDLTVAHMRAPAEYARCGPIESFHSDACRNDVPFLGPAGWLHAQSLDSIVGYYKEL